MRKQFGPPLVALPLAVVFLLLAAANQHIVDDAFITLQYARNLVAHGALTWWPDAPMVDGYTSLGHVLLLSAMHAAGINLLGANMALNLAALAAVCAIWLRAARGHTAVALAAGLATILVNSGFSYWVTGGLDGILFSGALLLVYLSFARSEVTGDFGPSMALTLIALSIIRPEGMVITVGVILFFWVSRLFGRPRLRVWLGPIAVIAAIAALTGWRQWLYGHPLPNTVYAKASANIWFELQSGWDYARSWILQEGGFIVLATPLALLMGSRAWLRLVFVAGMIALVVVAGGDSHPYGRFFLPVIPLVAFDTAWLVQQTWRSRLVAATLLPVYFYVHVLVALGPDAPLKTLSISAQRLAGSEWPYWRVEDSPYYTARRTAIVDLDARLIPGLPVVGTDVGAQAFFSERWIRDAIGLNDAELALLPKPDDRPNVWGYLQTGALIEQGAPVLNPYFPNYDRWTWEQVAAGTAACQRHSQIWYKVGRMRRFQYALNEFYDCASITAAEGSGKWLNFYIRRDLGADALEDPAGLHLSRCVPRLMVSCGFGTQRDPARQEYNAVAPAR